MKEKIIQGGIVNGVKMLVCPTWEEDFQTEIHKTGGCLMFLIGKNWKR